VSVDNKKYHWEGAGTLLPSGHTIFETHDGEDGSMWAIADESGDRPDTTEDGVLWLDPSRCLLVAKDDSFDEPREFTQIPVIKESDGKRYHVGCDAATILFLSRFFRWTIVDQDNGAFYNMR